MIELSPVDAILRDAFRHISPVIDRAYKAPFTQFKKLAEQIVKTLGRKMYKMEAGYLPYAPPPLLSVYECQYCGFFQPANLNLPLSKSNMNKCKVVGVKGDIGGENISPTAWCFWWVPNPKEPALKWLTPEGPVNQYCDVKV